jgi:hypothetical protein
MVSASRSPTEVETFEVIIPRSDNLQILLAEEGGRLLLPRLTIPKWERVAQAITKGMTESWNLKVICLFQPTDPNDFQEVRRRKRIVVEPCDGNWQVATNLRWVPRNALSSSLSSDEAIAVENVLRECDSRDSGLLPGPFARTGWLDELMSWAQPHLKSHGLKLTRQFQQFNATPFFALVRLETTGTPVWFKAVGSPNLHEFPITQEMVRLFPSYVPSLLAWRSSTNGWLMKHVGNSTLEDVNDLRTWRSAARTLASLQIDSIGRTSEMIHASFHDVRTNALSKLVDPYFSTMALLMEQQINVPPEPLTYKELSELAETMRMALEGLRDADLPDTLGHGDFNPGNVLVDEDLCIFIDWADAHVGNPFLTLEYLLAHLKKNCPELANQQEQIRSAYLSDWFNVAAGRQIEQALIYSPVIAAFAFGAMATCGSDDAKMKNESTGRFLRSVTRRIKREAEALLQRRAKWRN